MQDRFKFRYLFDNKLYEVVLIDFRLNKIYLKVDDKFPIRVEFDDKRLVQCTGLKDKNGKLIYEGDIIYKKGSKNYKKEKMYSRVCWDSMYAQFNISDENGMHQMPSNSNNIEVIGNIYENPELIKDGE